VWGLSDGLTAPEALKIKQLDAFLTGKTVERAPGNQANLRLQTLPQTTTVLVLGYE